jgi:hypothetical protein
VTEYGAIANNNEANTASQLFLNRDLTDKNKINTDNVLKSIDTSLPEIYETGIAKYGAILYNEVKLWTSV